MAESSFQVVRMKSGKNIFEVLAKVGKTELFRQGKLGINNVLASDEVFSGHHQKGEKATASDLKAAFGTESLPECAKQILLKGEVEFTAAERKAKADQRRLEIANYIQKYMCDPKTKLPHPLTRVQNALDTIKFHADPEINFDKQIQDVLKQIMTVLPCKKLEMEAVLTIPAEFIGAARGIVSKHCEVQKEDWADDGACLLSVTLVPGDYDVLTTALAQITKGNYQIDIAGGAPGAASAAAAAESSSKARGGKGKHGKGKH